MTQTMFHTDLFVLRIMAAPDNGKFLLRFFGIKMVSKTVAFTQILTWTSSEAQEELRQEELEAANAEIPAIVPATPPAAAPPAPPIGPESPVLRLC